MTSRPRVVLSMIVHNEADHYLERMLTANRCFIDAAMIIDDASTDATVEICQDVLQGIPLTLIRNSESHFANEVSLRRQQWEETIRLEPQWILNLDADEILESSFLKTMDTVLENKDHAAVYFRLYDMWDEEYYREDAYWRAHQLYRPFLVRYIPLAQYQWRNTAQHCGRFPLDVFHWPYLTHAARIRHYGWASAAVRARKYARYQTLDKDAKYGMKAQYDSILDEKPVLVRWTEEERVPNTRAYWDHRFQTDWEPNGGAGQVAFHGQLLFRLLPVQIKKELSEAPRTLCDVGCAGGEAVNLWSQLFPQARCTGVDFSETAIAKAKQRYGHCDFVVDDLQDLPATYDVVVASHVLQMFPQPKQTLENLLSKTRRYLVILASFVGGANRLPVEHQCRLDFPMFPLHWAGAQLVAFRRQDCTGMPESPWGGEQLLFVYAKQGEVDVSAWSLLDLMGG